MRIARISWCVSRAALAVPAALLLGALAPGEMRADEFALTRVDGEQASGALRQAFPALVLETADGELACAWGDVLTLAPRHAAASQPAQPRWRVQLSDGSALGAAALDVADGKLLLRPAGRESRIELPDLRTIERTDLPAVAGEARAVLEESEPTSDAAVVARGERVVTLRGSVTGLSPSGVAFRWERGDVAIPWDRLALLRLARPNQREAAALVHLRGGDVLAGRIVGGDAGRIELQSGLLERMALEWRDVARVDNRSRRVTFLSDLKPLLYEFTPLIEKRWAFAMDRSLRGGPLRVAGRPFERGVVLHSRALLAFGLNGEYARFAADVGILDETAGRGSALLRVLGDGRTLWEADEIRGGEPAQRVSLDVSGVQLLALVVDYGADLDLSDHVVWGMARVVRP